MEKIKAGIIGAAGYTGGELLRILINHPSASISYVHSRSNPGKPVSTVHHDLLAENQLNFTDNMDPVLNGELDVLFLCLGHGESKKFLAETKVSEFTRVIDLANDFRLKNQSAINGRDFIYGLPELNKELIKTAHNIANPGCFATAIQLGLLPLADKGVLKEVYTTGITGSTGAGQSLSATSHFSWRANNIQAYKTLTHQHLGEISESLRQLQGNEKNIEINFVPWRGDFTRGIFTSSTLSLQNSAEELLEWYKEFYASHPFVQVSADPIFLKQVVQTNYLFIQLEKVEGKLVIHTVMDNLVKGACGQAVQNMNLMFGLDETAGLKLKAGYF